MNALVGVRANSTGLMSIDPVKRRETAEKIAANAQGYSAVFRGKAAAKSVTTDNLAGAQQPRTFQQELDKDSFLQLMVLQMQNQDPTNPMDNSEMLAQLAQFSALEQMNNLNEGFETLASNVDQLNFMTASSLLGRRVSGIDMNGLPIAGTVESVHLDGSLVYLTVGDRLMSMAGVIAIDEPEVPTE